MTRTRGEVLQPDARSVCGSDPVPVGCILHALQSCSHAPGSCSSSSRRRRSAWTEPTASTIYGRTNVVRFDGLPRAARPWYAFYCTCKGYHCATLKSNLSIDPAPGSPGYPRLDTSIVAALSGSTSRTSVRMGTLSRGVPSLAPRTKSLRNLDQD